MLSNLEPIHKDLFDRILVAQAIVEGLTLVKSGLSDESLSADDSLVALNTMRPWKTMPPDAFPVGGNHKPGLLSRRVQGSAR